MRPWTRNRWVWIALAILAAIVVLGGGVTRQWLHAAAGERQQTLCVHNLHFMAYALRSYAGDHEGQFPERFSQLYPKYLTLVDVLICPRADPSALDTLRSASNPEIFDAASSYELAPGRRIDDPPNTLLAWERGDHHGGRGRSVLYVDGRGGWDPPEAWRRKELPPLMGDDETP